VSGVHACRAEDLPFWLGTELWIVELDHVVERARRKLVARKGRLIRRVEDWTPEAAAAFADGCAISLLRLATSRLQPGALPVDADTHPSVELAEDIRRRLDEGRIPPSERALLQYFCDAVAYRELPQAVGFIAELGHHSVGGPTAADAERHREAQWLIDRLGLAALHDRSHRDDR
jgi:hypothetical protein